MDTSIGDAQNRPWVIGQSSGNKSLVSGNADNKLSIQAQFIRPGVYTVAFTFDLLFPVNPTDAPLRAEATIEWMTGGNTITRIVSLISGGVSVQGQCEAVRIVVRDTSVPVTFGMALGIEYNVSVSVAPGPRGSYQNPPILNEALFGRVIGPAVTYIVPVPLNAGIKSVLVSASSNSGTPIPDQGVVVRQRDQAANDLMSYDPRAFQWAPLQPGVTDITVTNQTAGDSLTVAVVFGVDG